MRGRARTALLISAVLLLVLFLVATQLGEEDRTARRHAGPNTASETDLPEDPSIDVERRSLVPDWKPSDLGEGSQEERVDPAPDPEDRSNAGDDASLARRELAQKDEGAPAVTGGGGFGEGRIEGRVTYSGSIPEPDELDMSKDPRCVQIAGEEDRIRHEIEIDAKGGLAGAVVWVVGAGEGAHSPPEEKVVLRQERCRFRPDVIAIQVGQTLEVINEDPLLHNVHARAERSEFNQAMPRQGMRIEKRFKAEDLTATLSCDVHPWMEGRLFVFSHPFFAVTDASGRFTIDRLPGRGPWHLFVRHPHAGTRELPAASGKVEVHFAEGAL